MNRLWVRAVIGGIVGVLIVAMLILGNLWSDVGDNPSGNYEGPTPGFWSGGPTPVPKLLPQQRASKVLDIITERGPGRQASVVAALGLVAGAGGALVATLIDNRRRRQSGGFRAGLGITLLGAIIGLAISAVCLYILIVVIMLGI